MENLSNYIIAHALKNAIEFDKTDASKILPKLFKHGLKREDIKEVMPKIQQTVKEINSMKKEEQEKLFSKLENLIPEKEEREGLKELPNIGKNMVFRAAPFPSGAIHIGNARTFLLNAMYAEKYKGKIKLVMDDTIGSEQKPISPEAYDLIQESFDWLGIKYAKPIIYKSDRLKIYYKYAEKLIKKNKAYVCHCEQEILRENRKKGLECSCRQFPKEEQMKRWKKMFKAKMGSAVLRIKTDMLHPNPAFRDRVLFKISDRKHPKVKNKYRVWPTLEMSWAIDDHLLKITHIIRGNDLLIETDMERFIWNILGWKPPTTIHNGLINLSGIDAKISKSKAQKEVNSGEYSGWDDPRTWSIQSLKRRGIKSEAIREFIKDLGVTSNNTTVPIDTLYSINRKLIDKDANRFFFVPNPIKIKIKNKPEINKISIPIHPEKKETRELNVEEIFISKNDFENLKGKEIRLLHLYNIKLDKTKHEAEFTSTELKPNPKIQWVSNGIKCEILMPDSKLEKGIAEPTIKTLKKDEVLQFERFGFVKYDEIKNGKQTFWFTHK